MPTVIAHGLIAAAGYRAACPKRSEQEGVVADPSPLGPLVAAGLAALPDIDVAWWSLTTYGAPWGHRGMTHSLGFAVLVGTAAAMLFRKRLTFPDGTFGLVLCLVLATASHGVLDSLTNGGYGIALLAPFDHTRYFAPFQPIPVSPISANPLNPRLWAVIGREAPLFAPAAWALWTCRTRHPLWMRALQALALIASAAYWLR